MSTDNFAKSMQQKLATASDTEQVTKAEGLDSLTDELEESDLEAVSGGFAFANLDFINRLPGSSWFPEEGFAGKPLG